MENRTKYGAKTKMKKWATIKVITSQKEQAVTTICPSSNYQSLIWSKWHSTLRANWLDLSSELKCFQ